MKTVDLDRVEKDPWLSIQEKLYAFPQMMVEQWTEFHPSLRLLEDIVDCLYLPLYEMIHERHNS